MPGAEKMFRLLYKKYGSCCEILTAFPKPERGITSAGEDKLRWVRRLLSEDIPVHIVYKEEKKNYPYMSALDMIDGDFFWIIAWDD